MKVDQLERAAYIAAHRILMTDMSAPDLACPGARRSRAIDTIAGVIKEIFELHCNGRPNMAAAMALTADVAGKPPLDASIPRRAAVVLQLPRGDGEDRPKQWDVIPAQR